MGRRHCGGYARFGATACAARIVFDELTLGVIYMGKHNARCTRRRAEPGKSARVASSREAYYASGTLGVSLPPARHSAPPRCRLRITVAFSSFACLRPGKHFYTVQSPYQMDTFAPCPFSLSQLVDSRKALVWRNLSVSKRCTFLFPTSRLIRPSISRKSIYQGMKNKSRVQTWFNLNHFSEGQM
jgi:hypothetical protein